MNDAASIQGAAHWTDANFEKNLKAANDAGRPVFVDFFAEWCGPCQMAAPVVDSLAKAYAGKVDIVKVDVDQNRETAGKFGVMSIPTVVIIDGEELERKVGFPGEAGYREMLDKVAK